jgi:hypothetical protein
VELSRLNSDTHESSSHLSEPPSAPLRVMAVDDDPAICTYLCSFLAGRGYSSITFGNAEEAVKRYGLEPSRLESANVCQR